MPVNVKKTTLGLIGAAIFGTAFPDALIPREVADLKRVCSFAARHEMMQVVSYALQKLGVTYNDKVDELLQNELLNAAVRVESTVHAENAVSSAFEAAGVDFMLLKGAVIRNYYPEYYLRTSIDVDVLVKKEDVATAVDVLKKKFDMKVFERTTHDVTVGNETLGRIEIHHKIHEETHCKGTVAVLENVWESSLNSGHAYSMSPETFIFYHLAHMYKHVVGGGCGIRPFVDLKILLLRPYDEKTLSKMLKEGGLDKFFALSKRLINYWFFGGESDESVENFSDYILNAGVYGSLDNHIAMGSVTVGDRSKYIRSRIFWSYEKLKEKYPSLEGKKILTPFYQIRRWAGLLFGKKMKRSAAEFKASAQVTEKEKAMARKLLEDIGATAP